MSFADNNIREIIFFRHGETDWNKKKIFQGITDIELNEDGIKQAFDLSKALLTENIEYILSSPLKRAESTAKIVAKELDIHEKMHCEDEIIERNFGVLEGQNIPAMMEEYKEIFRIMDDLEDPESLHVRFEGAESKFEVLARVFKCSCNFMKNNSEYKKVAVSCHGGILRYINLYINGEVTDYGNCDYIKINCNDLDSHYEKLLTNNK